MSTKLTVSRTGLKVLVACESSGKVRDAFIALGHDAMSCDLLPTKQPGPHHQGDVRDVLGQDWDVLIAHPPCTYLSSSGLHWNKRRPGRSEQTEEGLAFARMFIDGPETAHIPKCAVENPVGCLSTRVRQPDQIIQPWMFGADASKATCLWLIGLPPLKATKYITPRVALNEGKWAIRGENQTDSGQNRLPPSDDRWELRSETYQGIANAFAQQWGLTNTEETCQ